jgi:hypothetical protein
MLQKRSRIGRIGPGQQWMLVHRIHESNITLYLQAVDSRARATVTQHRGRDLPALATHNVFGGNAAGYPRRVERVDVPVAGGNNLQRVTIVTVLAGQFSVDSLSGSENQNLTQG